MEQVEAMFPVPAGPHYPNGRPFILAAHVRDIEAEPLWQDRFSIDYDYRKYSYRRVGKYTVVYIDRVESDGTAKEAQRKIRDNRCEAYRCIRGSLLQHPAWMMVDSLALAASRSAHLPTLITVTSARCQERWTKGNVSDLVRMSWELSRYIVLSSPGNGGMGRPDHVHGHIAPWLVDTGDGKLSSPFGLTESGVAQEMKTSMPNSRAFLADWPCLAFGIEGPPDWKVRVMWQLMEDAGHKDYAMLISPSGPMFWVPRTSQRPDPDPRSQAGKPQLWGGFEACGCVLCKDSGIFATVTQGSLDKANRIIGVPLDDGEEHIRRFSQVL